MGESSGMTTESTTETEINQNIRTNDTIKSKGPLSAVIFTDANVETSESEEKESLPQFALKNEVKWKAVTPVGKRLTGTPFIPMKILYQFDEHHSPEVFVKNQSNVGLIIDLSNSHAPYEMPEHLSHVEVWKLPCVSKLTVEAQAIAVFISKVKKYMSSSPSKDIAVHCHYGFNRTGFVLCCYLIEVLGKTVSDATALFKEARGTGIKHDYFIEELHRRYDHVVADRLSPVGDDLLRPTVRGRLTSSPALSASGSDCEITLSHSKMRRARSYDRLKGLDGRLTPTVLGSCSTKGVEITC
eukprot:GFYU01001304.1.p1 GENE.GFYU01001304.1~~GFYU01001304.1.p1  ORF type:complete len:299 (+),score=49.51 GFYU01001304.1:553-1449(+)